LRFDGRGHRIDMSALTGGRAITVYGQQEVVKDLIAARLAAGDPILSRRATWRSLASTATRRRSASCTKAQRADSAATTSPVATASTASAAARYPAGVVTAFERVYPFAWLGILAEAPPTHDELIYAYHDHGFALYSMRSPEITRLYLQVGARRGPRRMADHRNLVRVAHAARNRPTAGSCAKGSSWSAVSPGMRKLRRWSRCSSAACSSRVTRRTSCRRRARRG
jgi:p-hydroxybenzoate 3-monooxygenase